jgi:FMN phosphatase YigB (HAD superfamily)
VVLASNSPSHHVLKVVRALGLADVAFQLLVTPDKIPGA